ncbi:TetR/AcrR family transcriptional regulator [Gordonia sp. SL306]|uniref:TetR/AcrR family transcriptional regulator n=1 Tax=Gordonia sp. SL306 TaxID=2995145 RepID=UPI002270ADCD|nr:TetR/AcrR family transcriptional regulator [Gordonia sp. SL306]WAC54164.1 helix-turn-helix domain containing protein [Gordonia sp. SL306]
MAEVTVSSIFFRSDDEDDGPAIRELLMDATLAVMQSDGYPAVTPKRIAATSGVAQAVVAHHFPSMDALFLAVLRRDAHAALERWRRALTDDDPLGALWLINSESRTTQLNAEFMALAIHCEAVAAELRTYARQAREIETAAFDMVLRARGIDVQKYPPVVLATILSGIGRTVTGEAALGITAAHAETMEFIERCLRQFEIASASD